MLLYHRGLAIPNLRQWALLLIEVPTHLAFRADSRNRPPEL